MNRNIVAQLDDDEFFTAEASSLAEEVGIAVDRGDVIITLAVGDATLAFKIANELIQQILQGRLRLDVQQSEPEVIKLDS